MILFALLMATQAGADVSAAKPKPDPDKLICRRESDTGSMMPRKVCHTRADWARIAGQNDDRLNRSGASIQGSSRPPAGS